MNTPNTFTPANSPASDDAEIVALGAVAVSRGPIGDIAVDSSGRVVVTNSTRPAPAGQTRTLITNRWSGTNSSTVVTSFTMNGQTPTEW